MKKKKAWTGESIRKLARQRMLAKDNAEKKGLDLEAPKKSKEDSPELLWGRFEKSLGEKVLIVISEEVIDAGDESARLCQTLGLGVSDVMTVKQPHRVDAGNYFGAGRLGSIKARAEALGVSAIVFEFSLSPVQVRNLEDHFKMPVLDRQAVILGIFKHHAKTKLAKIQVELAQLKYLQSRLSGIWSGLSRQRGAKAGIGGRGLGETRLELDRRVVKDRIARLKKKLANAEKSVVTQSKKRMNCPRAALVGYTNAGKSTLMQKLTRSEVHREDKLFSTLDTTVRAMMPPTDPRVLISDTVGFVRDLPHDLVLSFRSTLREAMTSQLLLHVLDFSHEDWLEQFRNAEKVLSDLGAEEIPRVFVLNKLDLLSDGVRLRRSKFAREIQDKFPGAPIVMISAMNGEGIEELRELIRDLCDTKEHSWRMAL